MKKIDDDLGGTTPLNIILKFPKSLNSDIENKDELDEWEEENDKNEEKAKYWFTRDKMDKILKVHDYLDSLPQIGKVLSFGSILRVAEDLNNKELQSLEIAVLYSKIPETIKKEIILPYISVENDEARISVRIKDFLKDLRRNDLIKKINFDLKEKLNFEENEFKLVGVLILFNNLLQSLFKSQILTLGIVILGIFAMFFVLFRNLTISLIGIIPNFIAAIFILGIIGLMEIPLDMMTITIAAITIGIAVDNSIHYIYRFREEFKKLNNYNQTLDRCHSTVGVAILNTSITIVFGFSILILSKFIPTIYFGIFTGIAMLLAMISVLTLLPKLIITLKPFGKEDKKSHMIENFFDDFFNKINLFDILILIILFYNVLQCFLKGFSLSLITFMKWIISTVITILAVPKLQPFVAQYIESEFINNVGLGIVIFILTLFITILIGKTLSKTVTWTGVGSIDKVFGFLFGFFKGYIVSVCLFSIFNWFYPYQNWGISAENAISFNLIKKGSEILVEEFPSSEDFINTKEKIEKI